jgi:hypothetical protein
MRTSHLYKLSKPLNVAGSVISVPWNLHSIAASLLDVAETRYEWFFVLLVQPSLRSLFLPLLRTLVGPIEPSELSPALRPARN